MHQSVQLDTVSLNVLTYWYLITSLPNPTGLKVELKESDHKVRNLIRVTQCCWWPMHVDGAQSNTDYILLIH